MRVFGAGTGFIFWALAARVLSAEHVGLASGVVSAASLFAGLAQLGFGYGLVRHFSSSKDQNGLLNFAIVISGGVGTLLALCFLIAIPALSPAMLPVRSSITSGFVFVLLVLSTTTTQLLHWFFLASRRLSLSLWKMSIQSVFAIILLPILWRFMSGYMAIVTAYLLSTVIGLAISFWPFLRMAHPGYRFSMSHGISLRSSFAGYSIINYITDQFQRTPDTLLPLIVIEQFGPGAGAYFFTVWTLGRSIAAWAGSIAESLFAEGSNNPEAAATQTWRAVKLGVLLATGLTLATTLCGHLILSIYGQQYLEQGTVLLNYVALAGIPGVLLSIFVNFLRVKNHLKAVTVIMAISVGSGLILSTAMMQINFAGIGIGWLISQTIVLLGAAIWWRWLRNSWGSTVRFKPDDGAQELEVVIGR
jgi:O-antigen/teichoic acid export membrane protein